MGLMIDSTVFVDGERRRKSLTEILVAISVRFGQVEVSLSAMTAGELLHGVSRADSPQRRAGRTEFVEAILAAIPVLPITLPIVRVFGEIDAKLCSRGRRLPTSDLLIACTALWRGDEVLTRSLRHFDRVPGLKVHRYP